MPARTQTTRERILTVARDLFAEHGTEAVTMRGIAGSVGLTPMALYRHFPNRAALLRAVSDEGHQTFLSYLQRALGERTAAARLARAGQEYLNFALQHPRHYAAMFMRSTGYEQRRAEPQWRDVATFRFLVDRIRECAAAGILRTDDPEAAALSVWAYVHGLVSLYLAKKLSLDEASFRKLFTRSTADLISAFPWSNPATSSRTRVART